jgi:hypothetical protein
LITAISPRPDRWLFRSEWQQCRNCNILPFSHSLQSSRTGLTRLRCLHLNFLHLDFLCSLPVFTRACFYPCLHLPLPLFAPACLCRYLSLPLPLPVSAPPCICTCLSLPLPVSAPACLCPCQSLPLPVSAPVCLCPCLSLPLPVSAPPCLYPSLPLWSSLILLYSACYSIPFLIWSACMSLPLSVSAPSPELLFCTLPVTLSFLNLVCLQVFTPVFLCPSP